MKSDPDLSLGPLAIYVKGHQFENSEDYWDGNWFRAVIECRVSGAQVIVEGPVFHRSEFEQWLEASEGLLQRNSEAAQLITLEGHLDIDLRLDRLGHLHVAVKITPDTLTQQHLFKLDLDQTYLARFARDLRRLLERFPQRGSPQEQ